MSTNPAALSPQTNQNGLVAALAEVRSALLVHAGAADEPGHADRTSHRQPEGVDAEAGSLEPEDDAVALDAICRGFALTPFERQILLMCAGVELDGSFASLCATAHGDERRTFPTLGLAMAALPDAHWSAVRPVAPLRRWRLVELTDPTSATTSPLHVDEYVLHMLAGAGSPDARLVGIAAPAQIGDPLPPSMDAVALSLSGLWKAPEPGLPAPLPCLVGPDLGSRAEVAGRAADYLRLGLLVIDGDGLPSDPAGLELVARLVERTCVMEGRAALIELADGDDRSATGSACRLADELSVPVALSARDLVTGRRRHSVGVDVRRPSSTEQHELWIAELRHSGAFQPDLHTWAEVNRVVGSFDLDRATIRAAAGTVAGTGDSLWSACRTTTRPRMDALAQRIDPAASADDLVLPPEQLTTLAEMALQVRHRATVYGEWGMRQGGRGLGTTALFAGPSGTGKTMAAEVLAADLRLDLYRVDLSAVVSKYIGETEKNLRQLFDVAEDGAAVLLFDEADALFGHRTEVKDSHDRYANVEVSYLLQRMEQYRGVAVLTTNFREALDPAFLRRIRFVVDFPFPDAAARQAIWVRIFPERTPSEDLDFAFLSRLNLAGGAIRQVAVSAAFHAAADGGVVQMKHVLTAARSELAKLDLSTRELERAF